MPRKRVFEVVPLRLKEGWGWKATRSGKELARFDTAQDCREVLAGYLGQPFPVDKFKLYAHQPRPEVPNDDHT